VHQLKAGDTVGYNRRGVLHRDSVVATLRAGYADGYPRSLGHGVGRVMIHGQSAPVLGTVCMDMLMVDVTDLHHPVQPGDEAELFGPQMPVQDLAKAAGTIAYEILTGIGQRVQRVYVRD
jgi:alanine racemase